MAPAEQAPSMCGEHDAAVLVGHRAADEHRPPVGMPRRRSGVEDLHDRSERVAGTHRLEPAHLLHSRRAAAVGSAQQAVDPQPRPCGAGVPAAGDEPPEGRVESGLRVDVEVLGIEAPAEVDDLGLGHLVGAEPDDITGREVLEEQRGLGHRIFLSAGALR